VSLAVNEHYFLNYTSAGFRLAQGSEVSSTKSVARATEILR